MTRAVKTITPVYGILHVLLSGRHQQMIISSETWVNGVDTFPLIQFPRWSLVIGSMSQVG